MVSSARFDPLTVRVGILEAYDRLTFQMHGRYRMETLAGEPLRDDKESALKWRVRIEESSPAQFLYSVLVASYRHREEAMALAESFEARNHSAVVRQVGGPIDIGGRIVGDHTMFRVQVGNYKTEVDASALRESLEDEFVPRIVREVLREGKGTLECFDANVVETASARNGFRLTPLSADARVTLFDVRTGTGFRYEKTENRDYAGLLEFFVDHSGRLAVVNEMAVDAYLCGVVAAEMPAGFPTEALKAQAILSRSILLAEKSVKHLNDPYELCGHVHCQVYGGLTHEDPRATEAVNQTRGQLLVRDGLLVDAYYSAVCGGHTEDSAAPGMTYSHTACRGVTCSCHSGLDVPDLTTESGVRRWILSSPEVCCNPQNHRHPSANDYARGHFRWEVSYTRPELEHIIHEKTGVDVGTLYDIVPVARGRSGRLHEIEILGSRRNLRIQRELKIRRALSNSALESSCFIVDVVHDDGGLPMEMVFNGAGWGHGVGLCQSGAARFAADGRSCEEIFRFYFPGCAVEKLY